MIKKILTMTMLSVTALFAGAQTPLPLDQAVKHGTLPNGLNYYIMHNEEPKERVNFYIAQKVGSSLEAPDQLGLAHFLEHMAFNGTTHYPGKAMLNYLQSKGIRFGADINAYTAFDETVYNIDNVPSTDKALVDSVLLAIHDWSCEILLAEEEINAERGVIQEEWRGRNSAMQRMYEAMLPVVYKEYQYQQMPIGKMEVVMNFAPQVLRDYYHKWYRPDQQGIIIVGDIDVAEMEKKVVDMFSPIPMPENAAERTYPEVSDNKEPIYFYYTDKELQVPIILVAFKSDKIPFEMRNTVEGYMATEVFQTLIADMINNRLDEYSKNPECKYLQAGVEFDDFLVSKTKDAFNIQIVAKDDIRGAYNDAMAIIARACKTGFTDSELVRSRDQLLANYEKAYNERNNTKTGNLARRIIRHFIDNTPNPGIETEYMLMQQMLPMIPVEAYNQMAASIMTPENQVIVVSQPTKEGMETVVEEEMVGDMQKIINAEYEAYVDEVITDPLISNLPAPGKIVSETQGEFGTTVFTLSNGAKVVVKPTDFKQDEILLEAFKLGGKQSYAPAQANDVLLVEDAYGTAKIGNFDQVKLKKYLAGKKVSLNYNIGNTVNEFGGSTTVKDLPTMMELLYASFTAVSPDEQAYNVQMDQAKSALKNLANNPQMVFRRAASKTVYGGNPMFQEPTVELIESANYGKEMEIYHQSVANAADYTFLFVGNVDLNTLKPLLEQYIATLPSTGKKNEVKALSSISPVMGKVDNTFMQPMQSPSTMVMTTAEGNNIPFNVDTDVKIDLLGEILSNIYTDTLREEEGGTYSPFAYGSISPFTGMWQIVSIFQTNDQMQEKLLNRSYDEFMNLINNGSDEANFNKVREAALKQYDINVRSNSYWKNGLMLFERGYDTLSGHKAALENLKLADFNNFLKGLYNGQDFIKVVMQGVPEEQK